MKSDLERKLTSYLEKIAPEEAIGVEIIIKQEGSVNTESEGVKSLVMMIQNIYLSSSAGVDSVSKLRDLVVILANALKEKEVVKRINAVWDGKEFGIPVPRIEKTLALQEKSVGRRMNSVGGVLMPNKLMQNFTYDGKSFTLADLDENLKACRHEIMAMFYKLYFRHNIQPTSNFNQFSKNFGAEGVLPKL